jgi:hypothetical protein
MQVRKAEIPIKGGNPMHGRRLPPQKNVVKSIDNPTGSSKVRFMGAATAIDVSDVSTEDLEAVLMGEVPAATADAPQPSEQQPDASGAGGASDEQGSSPSPQVETPPAPEESAAPEPEPEAEQEQEDEFANMAEEERRALEIRRRNPDLTLEAALGMARKQLGGGEDADGEQKEPTLAERIAAIESALDEAGANEGLFTKEVADLTKEHARLLAEQAAQEAVARVKQEAVTEERTAEMKAEREESYARAAASCPDALDPNTPIGKSLSAVIAEAERTNNPLLYDPQAPELFLALANARLPEAQRAELKRPAEATQTPSGEQPAATVQTPRQSPAGVLPVAASARTAQPATATIDPANVVGAIKETPTADLEAALLGASAGSSVLLRL